MLKKLFVMWVTPVRYMRVKIQEWVVENLLKMLIKKYFVNTGLS
jgi:hypothetical protein